MAINLEDSLNILKNNTIIKKCLLNDQYVFKSAGKKADFIVVLKKVIDTVTNEKRKGVINNMYAMFRGNIFFVEYIVNKFQKKELETIESSSQYGGIRLNYNLSSIISEPKYDNEVNNICTTGIHYFKSLEAAFYQGIVPSFFRGTYYSWTIHGSPAYKCSYANNKLVGQYIEWHKNEILLETFLKNDDVLDYKLLVGLRVKNK